MNHELRARFEREHPDPYGYKDRHTVEQRNKAFKKWLQAKDPIEQYQWNDKAAEERIYGKLQYRTYKKGTEWISTPVQGLIWHWWLESKKPPKPKKHINTNGDSLFAVAKKELLISTIATERYGLQLTHRGDRHILNCPFHPDRNPSCVIFDDNNTFYCSSNNCQAKGDLIEFIRRMEEQGGKSK